MKQRAWTFLLTLVLIVEGILYAAKLPEGKGGWKAALYAVEANLIPVSVGWILLP